MFNKFSGWLCQTLMVENLCLFLSPSKIGQTNSKRVQSCESLLSQVLSLQIHPLLTAKAHLQILMAHGKGHIISSPESPSSYSTLTTSVLCGWTQDCNILKARIMMCTSGPVKKKNNKTTGPNGKRNCACW